MTINLNQLRAMSDSERNAFLGSVSDAERESMLSARIQDALERDPEQTRQTIAGYLFPREA